MVPVIEQQLYYGTRSCTCYCTCTCARTNHVIVPCGSAHSTRFIHVMLVFTARISFMSCLCSQHAFHSCHACVHSTHFIHVMLVFTARISFMSCLCSQHTFHSCHACVHFHLWRLSMYMDSMHTVHVHAYCTCTVCILSMCMHTGHVQYAYCTWTVCILYMYSMHTVHVQYAYWTCTVCMHMDSVHAGVTFPKIHPDPDHHP